MRGKVNFMRWLTCVLILLMVSRMVIAGGVIYVDDDATGASKGSNWENAYVYLQDALTDAEAAEKPVEVRIAQGIYTPDHGFSHAPVGYLAYFRLINGVTIKGGFAGLSEVDPNARDVDFYKTILSGDLEGNDVEVKDPCDLYGPTRADNCRNVVVCSNADTTAVLDGLTITGGHSTMVLIEGLAGGAGMIIHSANPTLIDCVFTGNFANQVGGGIRNSGGSPTLINCTFSRNRGGRGGGMFNYDNGSPTLNNCIFHNNTSNTDGAGMYNHNSSPTLDNCTFINNYAGMNGGGMHNVRSLPILTYCTFTDNSAGDDGGAIYSGLTDISLSDCMFQENRAFGDGGGLLHVNSNIYLTGCTFVDNSALSAYQTIHSNNQGGAMLISIMSGNQAVATDCLFRNNSSTYGGAIQGNLTELRGCCFTGNVAYYRGGAIDGRGTLTCQSCLFEGNKAMEHVAVAQNLGALLFTNCTVVENRSPDGYTFLASGGHGAPQENVFINCIIWGADPIFRPGRSWLQKTLITYCNIQGGWPGEGNIDIDPYFAEQGYWDPNGTADDPNDDFWVEGDYHLRSEAGSWDPNSQSWVIDDVSSPCIDAGDPNSPVAFEPFPNGGIINMGAYGGTVEASKSLSGIHAKYGGGIGEPNDLYLIYTVEQMNTIGVNPDDWGKYFKLMADIDLSGYIGTDFNLIGVINSNPFSGVFDGNGHTISNFTYTSEYFQSVGSFVSIQGFNAVVKNLGMIDPNMSGTGGGVGSLAGRLLNGAIINCYVHGGRILGNSNVGGLVGSNDGTIEASYSHTSIIGIDEVGGIVGQNSYSGEIIDCYTMGKVSGQSKVGGFVGANNTVSIHGATLSGTISNCYSTTVVSGDENVGGLVGGDKDRGVIGSFWDIETSGQSSSYGGEDKTTAEMQMAGTFLDAGWDFVGKTENGTEDIWWIIEGQDYPRLWWQSAEEE